MGFPAMWTVINFYPDVVSQSGVKPSCFHPHGERCHIDENRKDQTPSEIIGVADSVRFRVAGSKALYNLKLSVKGLF